jgi:alpha-tubulin suppressor-like RCC1 family protein
VKEDGTVWSWGDNWGGQLGNGGTTNNREVPAQVYDSSGTGSLGGAKAVAAGWDHSLALKIDGTVWAWGDNDAGALGDGTTTTRSLPVRVQGGLTTVDAIAAGQGFSLALKHDGTVWAWGANWGWQLGDTTTTNRHTPVQVSGLTPLKAIAIAAGNNFGLALMEDHTVRAWGLNGEGQLGVGDLVERHQADVLTGLSNVKSIAAAWTHAVALKNDGNVFTWGSNWRGEQGDGTITSRPTPHLVNNLPLAQSIGVGAQMVIVLTQDDQVYWWGSNSYQPSSVITTPVQVQGITGATAGSTVSGGAGHSAARRADGTIWTWGDSYVGQLGYPTAVYVPTATQVASLGSGNLAVAAGWMHTLARGSGNSVVAWGYNSDGQVGDSTSTNRTTPVTVPGLSNITMIAAGYFHSFAVKNDGSVWGWGRNGNGQLGNDDTDTQLSPVWISDISSPSSIAGGEWHSLAIVSGAALAWGSNEGGQLGDGTNTERHLPVAVSGLTSGATAIACGSQFSLALKSDKTVWAWGGGWSGQLGNGTWAASSVPVQVTGLTDITAIAAGYAHGLALKSDGTVWAWGMNSYGQLGNGSFLNNNVPVRVSGLTGVTAIGAGGVFSLAVKSDGTIWAWGSGESGQLGNGTIAFEFSPVALGWP